MATSEYELSPVHLAEAMVVGAATELAFQDRLATHEVGAQRAVETAYVHIMTGALATARDLQTPDALFGREVAGAHLRMRAQVHVLATLAIRLVGMTGNQQPPRWQTLMHDTLDISPLDAGTGEDQAQDPAPSDPVARSLAARIHTAVAVQDHTC